MNGLRRQRVGGALESGWPSRRSRGKAARSTAFAVLGVLICLVAAGGMLCSPSPSSAKKKHNATLIHVGPLGLEAYKAWNRSSSTLVRGMLGSSYYPVLSPHGASAVTIVAGRTDRAYSTNMYASVISATAVPFELTISDASGSIGMTSFKGWLDDYTAVFQQPDPSDPGGAYVTIRRDTRTGAWSYYDGPVTYPAPGRKRTKADKVYSIAVSRKQIMTIRIRKTKRLVARFKVPGTGNGTSPTGWYYADASISPDKKFIAYELWRTPEPSAYVTWRTYVCTIGGKNARRIKNGDGGFVWK